MTALAAVVLAGFGSLAGLVGPRVISRLPEPEEPDEAKPLYRDIASAPRLGWWLAVVGAALGAVTGAGAGWSTALWPWGFLIPLGVVLSYIDLRTRLLPTRLIAPSYLVVVAMIGLAAWIDGSTDVLVRAAIGWLVVGSVYFLPWLIFPNAVGYGDVRLSGVIGLALGCVGWSEVLVGGWLGLFFGGISGLVLRPFTGLRLNAHGPGMVLGAVIGAAFGGPLLHALHR